jgi:hypothetical protein
VTLEIKWTERELESLAELALTTKANPPTASRCVSEEVCSRSAVTIRDRFYWRGSPWIGDSLAGDLDTRCHAGPHGRFRRQNRRQHR